VPDAGVTFDLWHTLVYLTAEEEDRYMDRQLAVGGQALARAPRTAGGPDLTEEELTSGFEAEYRAAAEAASVGRAVAPAEQLRRAGVRTGRRPSIEGYLAELERTVHETGFHEAPGATELLRSLTADGYWLAVISNTVGEPGAFLRPMLRSMGFDRYVRTYTFSDEHPWTKPAPEIFRATLGSGGIDATRAVHVGDGLADIEGARRAGLRAGILYIGLGDYGSRYRQLFAPGNRPSRRPEYEASTLEEVGELVRRILPRPSAMR
jgi:HAD superfamily hydrolase (TIGR01549 family)